jgi:hypothetical protein
VPVSTSKQVTYTPAVALSCPLLRDLLEYRERRRAEQYAALDATASLGLDDEEDLDTALEKLREARQAVARRRRGTGQAVMSGDLGVHGTA